MLSGAWERQKKMKRLGGPWGAIRHSLRSPAGRLGRGNCLTIDVGRELLEVNRGRNSFQNRELC
jgi:hypothetical protein